MKLSLPRVSIRSTLLVLTTALSFAAPTPRRFPMTLVAFFLVPMRYLPTARAERVA